MIGALAVYIQHSRVFQKIHLTLEPCTSSKAQKTLHYIVGIYEAAEVPK